MSAAQTSFRLPLALQIPEHITYKGDKIPLPTQLRDNVRMLFNAVLDSHQAIATLHTRLTDLQAQVNGLPAPTPATPAGPVPGGVQTNTAGLAAISLEPRATPGYTLRQADYGANVPVNGIPVTLSGAVGLNFFASISNHGSSSVSLVPDPNFPEMTITTPSGAAPAVAPGQTVTAWFDLPTRNWYTSA